MLEIEYWSYQNFIYDVLISENFEIIVDFDDRISRVVVTCIKHCDFHVWVNEWLSRYKNSTKIHCRKFSQCFLIKKHQKRIEKARLKKKQQNKKKRIQKKQARLARKQREKQARFEKKIEKARIKKERAKVFVCKRCFVKFSNNIKFYQHVQNYHQKKFKSISFEISTLNEIVLFIFKKLTLFVTFSQIFSKSSIISSFISSLISLSTFFIILFVFILFATFHATSKKQIFWAKIISKSISSKSLRLSFSMFEFLRNVSILLFIFLITRFYITMNDLFVMFVEKSKLLNLSYRQKHTFFQHHWRFNKFFIFCQTQITSYFLSSLIRSNSTSCRN